MYYVLILVMLTDLKLILCGTQFSEMGKNVFACSEGTFVRTDVRRRDVGLSVYRL